MNGRRPMMRCGDDVERGDYEDWATLITVVAGRVRYLGRGLKTCNLYIARTACETSCLFHGV